MPELPRSHLIAYALLGAVVLVVGIRQLAPGPPGDAASPVAETPVAITQDGGSAPGGGGRVVVHVAGAVRSPGVYRMKAGARVDDAVRRAGGPLPRADLTQVNLAAEVEDGRQIIVPRRVPASSPAPSGATAAAPAGPLNLNTATLEQLDTLQGVGPATAQAILDYREEQNGFSSVEELDQVPGIGAARLATLRDLVTV